MRTYEFQDMDGQNVRLQLSSANGVRIYLEKEKDKVKTESGHIHLTFNQVKIVVAALNELADLE